MRVDLRQALPQWSGKLREEIIFMRKKVLGQSGLEIRPLVLGTNVFGWTADEAESHRLLDRFVEQGFSLIDTADVYSVWIGKPGLSESIIGNWVKKSGKRDKLLIATKVGMQMAENRKGLSKGHILRSVEDSLKRLQTDVIDLYQSHQDDETVPLEETLEAYESLIKTGKVRFIGASNFKADRFAEALNLSEKLDRPRYQTLQPFYNLYDRKDFEQNLEELVLRKSIGVIPYFSLARGFLSGKYRSEADLSKSVRGGAVKDYLNERGFRILKALDQIAEVKKATPSQIALAWLIARPSITAPIASATSQKQLDDIMGAADLELTPGEIALLDKASAY